MGPYLLLRNSLLGFQPSLIRRYGIVKGFFLTIDRHGKCNKLSFYETLPNRINAKGKIIDSVNFYIRGNAKLFVLFALDYFIGCKRSV